MIVLKKSYLLIISAMIFSFIGLFSCSYDVPNNTPEYDVLVLTNDNYENFNDETKMSKYIGKEVYIKMASDIKGVTLTAVFYEGNFRNFFKFNEQTQENDYIYSILDFSDAEITSIYTYFCNNVKKIILSDKVTDFGDVGNAFLLEEIIVPENNTAFKSIDGILYDKNVTKVMAYPRNSQIEKLVIPETIKKLDNRIQQSVESSSTKEIVFPSEFEGFTANYAFYRIRNLEKVVFKTIIDPATGCFTECNKDLKFYVPAGKKQDFINKWSTWYNTAEYSGELADRVFESE